MKDELCRKIMKGFVGLRAKEAMKNNKLISKIQQRFKSEKHNIFTEEINKIPLSSNEDRRIQSIDSIETYARGKCKYLTMQRSSK